MVYSDMKNKNKDFVLYAKASVFPVGHENHGKRLLMERGSDLPGGKVRDGSHQAVKGRHRVSLVLAECS